MKDRLRNVSDVVFQNDRLIYYVEFNEKKRNYRLKKHILGENVNEPENDEVIFEEKDESFSIGINNTKDQKYLVLTSTNKNECEIYVLDYESQQMTKLLDRSEKRKMTVNHDGDKFIIMRDTQSTQDY